MVTWDKLRWLLDMMPFSLRMALKAFLSPRYYLKILVNDVKAYLGYFSSKVNIIFIVGVPKSGTTWVENFISNIPGFNPRILTGSRELLRLHYLPADAFSKIPKYGYSAIKTHTSPDKNNIDILVENDVTKVLVMYRDLRDVAVSMYYHNLKTPSWKPGDYYYANYKTMAKEDALSHSVNAVLDYYIPWIVGWRKVAAERKDIECKIVRYEDLLISPSEIFHSILHFFEVNINESEFASIMHSVDAVEQKSDSFLMLPGQKSTKRKGLIGEWKNELNSEQKRLMKEAAGELLVELEYEKNLDW